jgi:hypothetical protein
MKKLLLLPLIIIAITVHAQLSKDSAMARQIALQSDFVNKIKAMGFTPSLPAPRIILDNPRSWGNYDDSANTLETCDWTTLPAEQQAVFENFASHSGGAMTGEQFFQKAVYQWIFIHEMGHWWRACQHLTADPYENEKAANRIAYAYWHDRDPAFDQFMLGVFQAVVTNRPSPVPAGISKEQYLKDNYNNLPGGDAYSWYQSIMIVEVSKEKPVLTFQQAVSTTPPTSRKL